MSFKSWPYPKPWKTYEPQLDQLLTSPDFEYLNCKWEITFEKMLSSRSNELWDVRHHKLPRTKIKVAFIVLLLLGKRNDKPEIFGKVHVN